MYDDIHETICDSLYDGDIHVEEGDGDDDFNDGLIMIMITILAGDDGSRSHCRIHRTFAVDLHSNHCHSLYRTAILQQST